MVGAEPSDTEVKVPLPVGSRVILHKEYDIDSDGGYTAKPLYEATVVRHNPKTLDVEMSDGTNRAELIEKINRADGVEIIHDW